MNIKTEINPCDYHTPVRVIHHVEIQVLQLTLFQSVSLIVSLYDENSFIIDNKVVNVEGQEYANWANDDQYLLNLVLQKLNLTKKTSDN